MKKLFSFIVLLTSMSTELFAGTYTLRQSAANQMVFNSGVVNIAPSGTRTAQPGDVFIVPDNSANGGWQFIRLGNFNGDYFNPIRFVNPSTGPQIVIGTAGSGAQVVKMYGCSNIVWDGSNNPSLTYGFYFRGGEQATPTNAIFELNEAGANSYNCRFKSVYANGSVGRFGKFVFETPSSGNDMGFLIVEDSKFERVGYPTTSDNFSECIYTGNSFSTGVDPTTLPRSDSVIVRNCIFNQTAGEACQIKLALKVRIYGNKVYGAGDNQFSGQSYTFQTGENTSDVEIYDNEIHGSFGAVWFTKGHGNQRFYKNKIYDVDLTVPGAPDATIFYFVGYRYNSSYQALALQIDSNILYNCFSNKIFENNTSGVQLSGRYFDNCLVGSGYTTLFANKKAIDDTTGIINCYDTTGGPYVPKRRKGFQRTHLKVLSYLYPFKGLGLKTPGILTRRFAF